MYLQCNVKSTLIHNIFFEVKPHEHWVIKRIEWKYPFALTYPTTKRKFYTF